MYAQNFSSMLSDHAVNYLTDRGINENLAINHGIKHISRKDSELMTGHDIGGLLIPYYSPNGEIWTYRLRPLPIDWEHNKKEKEKYLKRDRKLPKFLSIKGEKNKPYLSNIIAWETIFKKTSKELIITEGEIKALSACSHDIATIGLSGSNNFVTSLADGKSEFLPELEQINWKGRNVGICYDSDIISNSAVQYAALKLINLLVERKANTYLIVLPRELNGEKNGIDDFIQRHGAEAFKQICHWHKIWQLEGENRTKILKWDKEAQEYSYNKFEPIVSVKGLLAWSVLKENWKYRPGFGWCEWKGKHWQVPNDGKNGENALLQQVKEFCRQQNWLNNNNHKSIYDEVSVLLYDFPLESQWNPPNILGFNNGYLNTDTNEFKPFTKEAYVTSILPFDYEPEAQCPQWQNFLNFTFRGDQNKIEYLRAWMRWVLTPKEDAPYPIEATLWLVGKPRHGKGTFLSVLRSLVGKENTGIFEPNDINDCNKLFSLVDKKLSFNEDVEAFIDNIPLYNRICSNEEVNVKHLYHDIFGTRLKTVTVLAMNKEVSFKGAGSEGFKSRLHVVRFDREPEKLDLDLKAKLRDELSGIFSWVWGLSFTQTKRILQWRIMDDVAEVFELNHPEIEFLRQTYPDGQPEIKASMLYKEYCEWSEENGYEPCKMKNFGHLMKQVRNVVYKKKKDGAYYSIPEMKNYSEINQENITPLNVLTNERVTDYQVVTDGDGCLVTDSNPYCEPMVQDVQDKSENFFSNKKENNSINTLPENDPQSCTIQTEPSFESCTTDHAPSVTKGIKPEESVQSYQYLIDTFGIDYIKDISEHDFNLYCVPMWFENLLQPEIDKILAIRKGEKIEEKVEVKEEKKAINKPINKPKTDKPINKSTKPSNYIPKPQAPEFNLSDVLPHLEPGKGKHKRNYVCPCCKEDYLSVNPSKGYKCFNSKTNCDTKEIYKELVAILKENDFRWQQYQRDMEEWAQKMNERSKNN